uniref:Uncharacterized protein n=1 Tax=Arundo donax TaxID=35708 RepID=A0A0A9ABK1_ARUDO
MNVLNCSRGAIQLFTGRI